MSNAREDHRILGSLGSTAGKGLVRMRDRLESGVAEVSSALTDAARLAVWYGEVEGELRPGGESHAQLFASG